MSELRPRRRVPLYVPCCFAMMAAALLLCYYLTHLALHYDEPITTVELDAYLEQYEGRVMQARDGLSFPI